MTARGHRARYVGTAAWAGLEPGERGGGRERPGGQVSATRAAGRRSQPGVERRCVDGQLPRTTVGERVVTTLARTVVDLARTEPFASGLMAADAALGRSPALDSGRSPGQARPFDEAALVRELEAELVASPRPDPRPSRLVSSGPFTLAGRGGSPVPAEGGDGSGRRRVGGGGTGQRATASTTVSTAPKIVSKHRR